MEAANPGFTAHPRRRSRHTDRLPVWIVSGIVGLNGLFSVFQVLSARFRTGTVFFGLALPYGVHHWSKLLNLVFGFALVYLSLHLARRKRAAWWLAAASLAAVSATYPLHGRPLAALFAPAAALAALFVWRSRFTVRSEPASMARGLLALGVSFAVALVYGVVGFWLLDARDFGMGFRLGDAVSRTIRQYMLVGNSDLVPQTRYARWFLVSLDSMAIVAVVFAATSLFRPLRYRLRTLPLEREKARALLERYGGSALGYFALWPDKSFCFDEGGEAFVAYRVGSGVAVCLGDPVGPPERIEGVVACFAEFCHANGWKAAFHETGPGWLTGYSGLGFGVMKIGEEAVVDLEIFGEKTSKGKEFRRIDRRFGEEGYQAERYEPPHAAELLRELEAVSDAWLSLPGRRERTFTLGSFSRGYVSACPVFVVRGPEGGAVAFANEIPSYREGEATIDMMRHVPEAPNGTMDFLFLRLLRVLREAGYRRFDLGLAPLAGVGEASGSSIEERAAHMVYQHLTKVFSFKGLRRYKAKFDPVWEPRYLIYEGGPLGLTKTAAAIWAISR